jgi:FADH2 O2-dependent halogenase
VERQFSSAAAARDWVSTDRLQYTSSRTVGDRWCLTAHAASFVDPLYSRGLTDTLDSINALGGRLLDALRDDDFRAERFQAVQDIEKARLRNNDNLVANTFTAFQDFDLLNAWLRVWITEQFDLNLESVRAYWRLLSSGDLSGVARLEEVALRSSDAEFSPANRLYNRANEEILRVESGEQSTQAAARAIAKLITEADFIPPALKLRDMSCRSMRLITAKNLAQVLSWARKSGPPHTRDLVIEGVSAFFKLRMRPGEFNRSEELKHMIADVPVRRAWAKATR